MDDDIHLSIDFVRRHLDPRLPFTAFEQAFLELRAISWRCSEDEQQLMLPLAPMVGIILDRLETQPELMSIACAALQNLTLWEKSCKHLAREKSIISKLVHIVRHHQRLPEGGTLCAALALANICAQSTDEVLLDQLHDLFPFAQLVECFQASFRSEPYGNLWWDLREVALGMYSVSQVPRYREQLIANGAFPAIKVAMQKHSLQQQQKQAELVSESEDEAEQIYDAQITGWLLHSLWALCPLWMRSKGFEP